MTSINMGQRDRVRIVGCDHPHRGEIGTDPLHGFCVALTRDQKREPETGT